ncbi:hypothetical protein V1507DRAFT_463558 [Lipomyces tetrasporus]
MGNFLRYDARRYGANAWLRKLLIVLSWRISALYKFVVIFLGSQPVVGVPHFNPALVASCNYRHPRGKSPA